jgi:hypothetical protein
MAKLDWMQFYPVAWRSDISLRRVSFAARGLWIDMLTIMHEAKPRGVLLVEGEIVKTDFLARLLGADVGEVERLLAELESAGVFSRKKNGAIYSRRMEADEARRMKQSINGKKGGNPILKSGGGLSGGLTQNPNSNPTLFDPLPENRKRISGESDENRLSANIENETEKTGSLKGILKPRVLEIREERKEEPPIAPQKATNDRQAVEACVKAWNALALDCSLPKVQLVSEARRSKLIARLREVGGLEGWFALCDKIRNSKFLRGESGRWQVSFDWVLSPTNLAKIMEGNFDDKRTSGNGKQSFADAIAAERDRIIERGIALEGEGDLDRDESPDPPRRDRRRDRGD